MAKWSKWVCLTLLGTLFLFCNPATAARKNDCDCPIESHKIVVGEAEIMTLIPEEVKLKARIDTGAKSSSLGIAGKVKYFEREGKKWVQFQILDPKSKQLVEFKRPVVRLVKIKHTDAPSEERAVVRMHIRLETMEDYIEVSLANRDQFKYAALIGRNFLSGRAVVDISQSFTQSKKD